MQSKRGEFIDLFRAFGILCMIMGHVGFGDHFDYYIHAFHMPMFYFVSGYFFRDKGKAFGMVIRQKARSLLLPYSVFGAGYFAFDLLRKGVSAELIQKNLYHFLLENTDQLPIGGALWFLTSIFFTDLIFLAVSRLCSNTPIRTAVLIVLGTLGCIWTVIIHFRLPWALDTALAGLIFYLMGNWYKAYVASERLKWLGRVYVFLPLLLVNMILIFVNGYVNMREGTYAVVPLSWFNALCAILGFWNLFKWADELHKPDVVTKFLLLVKSVGRDSIVYLLTNQMVIWVFNRLLKHISLPVPVRKLLLLIVSLVVMYGIAVLLTRTALSVLIGRPCPKQIITQQEPNP